MSSALPASTVTMSTSPPSSLPLREDLLEAEEPQPVERVNPAGGTPVVVVCDHAAPRVPRRLKELGLDPASFARHIAWDIGAAEVTRHLAGLLGAPALLTAYSRLVVDPNRGLDDPTQIPLISDGTIIPGNRHLSAADRAARIEALFHPYHRAVAATIAAKRAEGPPPALLSIHSFTPVFKAESRPWAIGVLWNRDPRLAMPMITALGAAGDIVVGDNQPYSGRDGYGYTVEAHAERAGLPHVTVEIRQDLLASPAATKAWAERLQGVLAPLLADPGLYRIQHY